MLVGPTQTRFNTDGLCFSSFFVDKPIKKISPLFSQRALWLKSHSLERIPVPTASCFKIPDCIIDSVGGLVNFSSLRAMPRLQTQSLVEASAGTKSVSILSRGRFELDFKSNLFIMLTCSSSEIHCLWEESIPGSAFQDRTCQLSDDVRQFGPKIWRPQFDAVGHRLDWIRREWCWCSLAPHHFVVLTDTTFA